MEVKYKISVHSNIALFTIATVTEVTISIRLFLSGDYEFLCALNCHSGASGMRAEFLKKGNTQHVYTLT